MAIYYHVRLYFNLMNSSVEINRFSLLNSIIMSTKTKISATALLCELVKLKSQQKYLESSQLQIHLNECSSEDYATLTEINNLQEQLQTQILTFKLSLKNDLENVSSKISSFKELIANPNDILLHNTKEYRDHIILIDQTFRNTHQSNIEHLSRLKEEYCDLETNVLPANYLLNETIKICPNIANVSRAGMVRPIDKDDNVDIKKFDDFLVSNNGHTGGWNDEEHFLFLKLKTKYKENIDQIVMSIQHISGGKFKNVILIFILFLYFPFLSDKTEEDIRNHNQWYVKYVELKEKKRAAIKNWKDSRMESY